MTELELQVYGRVAQAIARHALAMAEAQDHEYRHAFPDAPGPIYYHWATSNFEAAAYDLWRLRILKPLDQEKNGANYFVFDCQVTDSNVVAERNALLGPTLFELLVTFINLFGEFGPEYWGFSTKPDVAFGRNRQIQPTLDTLAAAGYLAKTDEGYTWTRLIAPAMLESYMYKEWIEPEPRRAD
jgi:hypothetical protein